MAEVKHSRPRTTISSKHQVTIPVAALREAGLSVGDRLVAQVEGPGRVVLVREDDVLARLAGALTGTWAADDLDGLRDEWS